MLDLINAYYQCWARRDRDGARALLADDVRFRSPWDKFDSADAYLDECWALRADVESVMVFESAVEGDKAFVAAEWMVNDGTSFGDATFFQAANGKIVRILIVAAGNDVLRQFA
jgi:ketosteroid isomerase-like protein